MPFALEIGGRTYDLSHENGILTSWKRTFFAVMCGRLRNGLLVSKLKCRIVKPLNGSSKPIFLISSKWCVHNKRCVPKPPFGLRNKRHFNGIVRVCTEQIVGFEIQMVRREVHDQSFRSSFASWSKCDVHTQRSFFKKTFWRLKWGYCSRYCAGI